MSVQEKNVSVNMAAFQAAKFLRGISNISDEATVVLFRMLVLEESVNPTLPTSKELIKEDIVAPFGQLRSWVGGFMGSAIEELVANAGVNLLPLSEPAKIE